MQSKRRGALIRAIAAGLSAMMLLAPAGLAAESTDGSGQTQDAAASHVSYMQGSSDGLFYPESAVTRMELAQMLYVLVGGTPDDQPAFPDVAADAWYAPAVTAVAGLGLMEADADGNFNPERSVTRAELAVTLAWLIPGKSRDRLDFSDVPATYWAYDAISRAGGYGLFQGDAYGLFHPENTLTRAETAAVFNRLLHYEVDTVTVTAAPDLHVFPDVPASHWAYGEIMEATTDHEYVTVNGQEVWTTYTAEKKVLTDGFYRMDGRLYCVQDGVFVRSASVGYLTFDSDGRYTTGNAELDARLNAIVEAYTNDSMTRDQKLRALYNYVRDHYTYLSRPLISKGQTGWEPEYALFFLQNGKGNCYSFSATYCLLCRELGLQAYTVVGGLGSSASPHGWVEIVLDGSRYMFDPQLEWRYLHDYGRTGYDLFKMTPGKTPFLYTW